MQSYNTLSEIKIPIDDLMPNITNYAKSNAPPVSASLSSEPVPSTLSANSSRIYSRCPSFENIELAFTEIIKRNLETITRIGRADIAAKGRRAVGLCHRY